MDLIDMKNSPSKGMSVILVLVDVFTRRAWCAASVSKTSDSISKTLRPMLNALPTLPASIFSDAGNEFLGDTALLLEEKGIVQQTRSDKHDVNVLAVIDRAIQNLKGRLAKVIAAEGGEWKDRLKSITDGYNATDHSTVHGEPNDAANDGVQKFLILQDNAAKAAHNTEVLEKRTKALEKTMTFRRPKGGLTKFKRGFKAGYGDVEKVKKIEGSQVRTQNAGSIDIKRVMPVARNSTYVDPTFAEWSERDERKRAKVLDLIERLQDKLGANEMSMVRAVRFLKAHYGEDVYKNLLDSVHFHNLADVIRLFPGSLELTKQNYYVRNV